MTPNLLFIDTWAYRALADRSDPGHAGARNRLADLLAGGASPITSNYILDEALTGIRMAAGARTAIAFGDDIRDLIASGTLRVEWVDEDRELAAWVLFKRYRQIAKLSFTDCTSFAIMQALGIERVLTQDAHFRQVNLGFMLV